MYVAVRQHNISGHSRRRACAKHVRACGSEGDTGNGFAVWAGQKYVGRDISIRLLRHGIKRSSKIWICRRRLNFILKFIDYYIITLIFSSDNILPLSNNFRYGPG